jgi:hypothetical protein
MRVLVLFPSTNVRHFGYPVVRFFFGTLLFLLKYIFQYKPHLVVILRHFIPVSLKLYMHLVVGRNMRQQRGSSEHDLTRFQLLSWSWAVDFLFDCLCRNDMCVVTTGVHRSEDPVENDLPADTSSCDKIGLRVGARKQRRRVPWIYIRLFVARFEKFFHNADSFFVQLAVCLHKCNVKRGG